MLPANDLPSATVGSMQSQITIHWRALKTQQRVQYDIFQELFAWLESQIYQTLQQLFALYFKSQNENFIYPFLTKGPYLKTVMETSSTDFAQVK